MRDQAQDSSRARTAAMRLTSAASSITPLMMRECARETSWLSGKGSSAYWCPERRSSSSRRVRGGRTVACPMAVYDNVKYLDEEQDLIRHALKRKIPVLNICLGSQLIAQAIGGTVYKGGKKEIGWFNVKVNPVHNDLFKGISTKSSKVFHWHGDTYDLPPKATIMASSKLYPQAFRFGSAVGIQFHMEVTGEMIERWTKEYNQELERERITPTDLLVNKDCEIKELYEICKVVYSSFSKMINDNSF
jgi:GMP synthase (glutamine-hydrolysing)